VTGIARYIHAQLWRHMTNKRIRDFGVRIGKYATGPLNAITDVPGVLVGQVSFIQDSPFVARTGVTAVFPRPDIHHDFAFGAFHSFNGIGEMTGLPYLNETGLLTSPVILTNTHQVGMAYDAVVRYGAKKYGGFSYKLPVIAETYDGWLNDLDSFPLSQEHIVAALENARDGAVAEGNAGGGTGMICYEFKGGTGTASRKVQVCSQEYTVGVLVQANHGNRADLLMDGIPVGREIGDDKVPLPWPATPETSSILIVIATDAPLLPNQCKRLAQRGTTGLARTGGMGLDGSGDLFLAFSTGIHYLPGSDELKTLQIVPHNAMDALIVGVVEAVEEAILNVLVAAESMNGYQGHTAHALPHDRLTGIIRQYRYKPA
jgi:D-aminopeptidase